jgi:hypothetical protein
MKKWCRGVQDLEYFWMAKERSKESEMKTILNNCETTAVREAKGQKDVSW